jgi:hypothetical protein
MGKRHSTPIQIHALLLPPFTISSLAQFLQSSSAAKEGRHTSDEPCAKEVMMRVISYGKAAEEPVNCLARMTLGGEECWVIRWLLIKTELTIGGQLVGCLI